MSIADKYQILKLVAKGGTAVLYSAVQKSLDRIVAIKKLHQHLTEDENFTRRFALEAKAAASLDHDNIVKIIDFGIEDDTYLMVMEFIQGESLREILDKWKHLPTETALAIAYEVAQGLEHAHAKGIVHRDIKPGNIMLTTSGRVKITDFGLAKLAQQTSQHTAADSILGTPLYMSPEQAFGETVDHRSDIFSLGTTLYEMLTGAQPFRDEHYMAVIQNIIKKNAPHPSKFNVDIPPAVQTILSKAMNKSREARFQSAGDFKKAIEKYLGLGELKKTNENLKYLLKTDGDTLVLPKTSSGRRSHKRLRRGFVVALVAVVLFGLASFGYTLGPGALQRGMDSITSWLDEKGRFQGGVDGQLTAAASGSVYPDTSLPFPDTLPAAPRDLQVTTTLEGPTTPDSVPQPREQATPEKPVTAATSPVPAPLAAQQAPEPAKAQSAPPNAIPQTEPEKAEKPQEPKRGWLLVTAEPWAEVYVDGAYRGDTPPPMRLELLRGPHHVECRTPGHQPYSETIQITAGELSTRRVILKKLKGLLRISTEPGAEIYVDGTLAGVTPLGKALELDAGDHRVTVKKAGFNVWNNQVTVTANQELTLAITLSPLY